MARILCVDDEEHIGDIMKEFLEEEWGHDVINVHDGEEALEMAKKDEKLDLIITDFNMPIMTGSTFINELRNHDGTNTHCPVIFLSAYVDPAKDSASHLENVNFLDKPIRIPKLKKLIQDLLK